MSEAILTGYRLGDFPIPIINTTCGSSLKLKPMRKRIWHESTKLMLTVLAPSGVRKIGYFQVDNYDGIEYITFNTLEDVVITNVPKKFEHKINVESITKISITMNDEHEIFEVTLY